jgi:hypothetical protein
MKTVREAVVPGQEGSLELVLPRGGPRWGMRWEGEEGHRRPWLGASRSMSLAEVLILDLVVIVLGEELPVVATTLGRKAVELGEAARPNAVVVRLQLAPLSWI